MKLEIRQPDKDPRSFDVEQGIYTIGSDEDCRLCLPHSDVDSRHAVLTITDSAIWIDDLNARATTTVNGSPVRNRTAVEHEEVIGVGPYSLIVHVAQPVPAEPAPPTPKPTPVATPEPKPEPIAADKVPEKEEEEDPLIEQKRSITAQIHRELLERMDIRRMTAAHVDPEELGKRAHETIVDIVNDVRKRLPPSIKSQDLIREVYNEALKLGPLEDLLEDPDITEIMVNGHKKVYIEKAGKLIRTNRTFMNDDSVLAIIERIVSPIGRRIDESQPYVDARLPDGSRVNAIIHPLSLIGPCLTIRKFAKIPLTDENMMNYGTFTPGMAEFFRICVMLRKNIIVSGGTGSGKTTLLNVLSNYLPDHDRIVTIEDAAELRLGQQHVVRLEARPPNIEGKGAITIRDLVRNALRMRPDRIIVGECRGSEALDMLQAMNTGHDGSLTTIHSNSPRDVISRLETMVLMSGMDLPVRAIREQVASAIDVIVHESRFSDGTRKVTRVTEIVGLEGDLITMQDIFEHTQTGVGEDGHVIGHFSPTGAIPTFIEDIAARGLTIDRGMFDPMRKDA